MRNILVLVLVLCFSINITLLAQSGVNITPATSRSIINVAENTLRYLQTEQISNIEPYLYNGMKIELLTSDELRNLTLDFIDGKITEFEYRIKMSGHNMAMFSRDNAIVFSSYEILDRIYVGNTIDDSDSRLNYYFLKANALYQNVTKDNNGDDLLVPVEIQIELQIAIIRNELKIIGFII